MVTYRRSHSLTVASYDPVASKRCERRPGAMKRVGRTAREHAGVRIELDGVHFAHVARQSACRHRLCDVPDKDRPVSARGRKRGIVVAPGRRQVKTMTGVWPGRTRIWRGLRIRAPRRI